MLPILPLAQLVYGGFNPYGTSKQPAIALGRSIAHAFGSGTGPQPDASTGGGGINDYISHLFQNNQLQQIMANRPFDPFSQYAPRTPPGGYQPAGTDLGTPSNPNAPAPFVPPSWVMPPTQEFGGAGFGNYAQAQNAFIPGLIAWNGPGQANPTGREPGMFEDESAKFQATHNIGAGWWNAGAGGRGGSTGPLGTRFK